MNRPLGYAVFFLCSISEALAGATNSRAFISGIPTLDDLGLTVLTLVVAIAGGFAARHRKKK